MHRSRSSLLVIFAVVAACSSRDDSEVNELLSRDSTLIAQVDVREKVEQPLRLPDACGTVATTVQPAPANRSQAEKLARQAYDAELIGDVEQARTLLRRASELDGTDKSVTYHLARANETLGDRAAAVTAYCRFLTLAPTSAESAEARQRVALLSPREARVASGGTATVSRVSVATARRVRRAPSTRARVATAAVGQPSRGSSGRGTYSVGATEVDASGSAMPSGSTTTTSEVDGGDVVAMPRRGPIVDQPTTTARTSSRGPSRVQGAGMGAVAGAIIGAATGRSVKSAVIGAAAGGVLGTIMVGQGGRP